LALPQVTIFLKSGQINRNDIAGQALTGSAEFVIIPDLRQLDFCAVVIKIRTLIYDKLLILPIKT